MYCLSISISTHFLIIEMEGAKRAWWNRFYKIHKLLSWPCSDSTPPGSERCASEASSTSWSSRWRPEVNLNPDNFSIPNLPEGTSSCPPRLRGVWPRPPGLSPSGLCQRSWTWHACWCTWIRKVMNPCSCCSSYLRLSEMTLSWPRDSPGMVSSLASSRDCTYLHRGHMLDCTIHTCTYWTLHNVYLGNWSSVSLVVSRSSL